MTADIATPLFLRGCQVSAVVADDDASRRSMSWGGGSRSGRGATAGDGVVYSTGDGGRLSGAGIWDAAAGMNCSRDLLLRPRPPASWVSGRPRRATARPGRTAQDVCVSRWIRLLDTARARIHQGHAGAPVGSLLAASSCTSRRQLLRRADGRFAERAVAMQPRDTGVAQAVRPNLQSCIIAGVHREGWTHRVVARGVGFFPRDERREACDEWHGCAGGGAAHDAGDDDDDDKHTGRVPSMLAAPGRTNPLRPCCKLAAMAGRRRCPGGDQGCTECGEELVGSGV
ncbi:hypothetical protein MRB53_040749 [Persea americana]|nr:hypothetical protein MRB53_040749 [Persea americana]